MDANNLCMFLAQRIPAEQFQIHGLEVWWMSKDYDTPENSAIVEDVIANYDTLEAAYLADEAAKIAAEEIKTKLKEIDLKSIRSMREWVAAQPDAPAYIKDFEIEAADERIKLK
jgi:hypothetical protein